MQEKGREVQGSDNKHYALEEFFESNNRLACSECGCLLDPYYRSLRIEFKSIFDFSSTYEGVHVVSKRFREYIEMEGYNNVVFYPVNEENRFFYFLVLNNVIKVNREKSGIEYHEKCLICHYPSEIIGGLDVFVTQEGPLTDGFYTTDVFWRTHDIFSPRILIGLETHNKLKAQKFKGLDMVVKVF